MMRTLRSLLTPNRPPEVPEQKPASPAVSATGPAAAVEQQVHALLAQGKTAQALRTVQQARASTPGSPGLAYLLGVSLDNVGRHEEALEAYREELALNPGHAAALARRKELEAALAAPEVQHIPVEQRSWHTSLERPTLLSLQKSLHNYKYRGVPLLKNPFDLALYPLLLWRFKPRTILELGSKSGGSGLWLGDLLDNFGIDGHVFSVDIVKVETVSHPRVTFLEGDGRALDESLRPEFLRNLPRPWLVIEDADHAYETSSAVLKFFHPWLQPREFIVVEDGIISDLSEIPDCNSGPHRALKEFLAQHRGEYEIDADYCDFFGYNLTWCTNGFLRKTEHAGATVEQAVPAAKALDQTNRPVASAKAATPRQLNLGCGARFHPAWLNLDIAPASPEVQQHDLRRPLPFDAGSFDAVYCSHVLEHLPHRQALPFVRECRRVLASGGVFRVVVPDLEMIARLYLKSLEGGLGGDAQQARRYEWMVLELLDQMVREESGGDMLKYWQQNPMPAEDFVIERVGNEVKQYLSAYRQSRAQTAAPPAPAPPPTAEEAGRFRVGGEVHKWMYDRYSLGRLLAEAGFVEVKACAANESRIPGFNGFLLDLSDNGSVRKPDSLFMEARNP